MAQSRALETELRQANLAYEIVGGVSFFQRREVKDLLAYLRLLVNPADTSAFFRIWNTPRRGLGPVVQAQVEAKLAAGANEPLRALRQVLDEGALKGAARAGAAGLLALYDDLGARATEAPDLLFARLVDKSGYLAHLEASSEHDFEERRANIEELGASAASFAAAGRGGLLDYLSECSLLTDADRLDENADRVLMLTVHNAKGLEFDAVAIAGLEEGLLPHASSFDDESQLEEERRLFYVALTRARDVVLLTAAAYRRRFDGTWGGQVSRFVDEVPVELLRREGGAANGAGRAFASGRAVPARGAFRSNSPREVDTARWGDGRAYQKDEYADVAFDVEELPGGPSHGVSAPGRSPEARRAVGQRVYHEKFGHGTVLEAEGTGPDMKLTVRFTSAIKKVLARFVAGGADAD
jgi:DNA helicase-2/ATP-dependent DNA helicase PcrA